MPIRMTVLSSSVRRTLPRPTDTPADNRADGRTPPDLTTSVHVDVRLPSGGGLTVRPVVGGTAGT